MTEEEKWEKEWEEEFMELDSIKYYFERKAFYLQACRKRQEESNKEIERLKEGQPKIICLCGSTRFTEEMLVKQWELTKQGFIVLSWCALPDWYFLPISSDRTHIGDQEGVKEIVDEVHKRKIDLADEVFVLNIGGYIGQSTKSEIEYAKIHGKIISYLEEAK